MADFLVSSLWSLFVVLSVSVRQHDKAVRVTLLVSVSRKCAMGHVYIGGFRPSADMPVLLSCLWFCVKCHSRFCFLQVSKLRALVVILIAVAAVAVVTAIAILVAAVFSSLLVALLLLLRNCWHGMAWSMIVIDIASQTRVDVHTC